MNTWGTSITCPMRKLLPTDTLPLPSRHNLIQRRASNIHCFQSSTNNWNVYLNPRVLQETSAMKWEGISREYPPERAREEYPKWDARNRRLYCNGRIQQAQPPRVHTKIAEMPSSTSLSFEVAAVFPLSMNSWLLLPELHSLYIKIASLDIPPYPAPPWEWRNSLMFHSNQCTDFLLRGCKVGYGQSEPRFPCERSLRLPKHSTHAKRSASWSKLE